jgi:hypothetical protein
MFSIVATELAVTIIFLIVKPAAGGQVSMKALARNAECFELPVYGSVITS